MVSCNDILDFAFHHGIFDAKLASSSTYNQPIQLEHNAKIQAFFSTPISKVLTHRSDGLKKDPPMAMSVNDSVWDLVKVLSVGNVICTSHYSDLQVIDIV